MFFEFFKITLRFEYTAPKTGPFLGIKGLSFFGPSRATILQLSREDGIVSPNLQDILELSQKYTIAVGISGAAKNGRNSPGTIYLGENDWKVSGKLGELMKIQFEKVVPIPPNNLVEIRFEIKVIFLRNKV